MAIKGNQRQSKAINGNQWQSMAIKGNQWQSMAIHRASMAISGNQRQSIVRQRQSAERGPGSRSEQSGAHLPHGQSEALRAIWCAPPRWAIRSTPSNLARTSQMGNQNPSNLARTSQMGAERQRISPDEMNVAGTIAPPTPLVPSGPKRQPSSPVGAILAPRRRTSSLPYAPLTCQGEAR